MNVFEQRVVHALGPVSGMLVAGISGGADSVALLRVLHASGHPLLAVTCDFHLRGDESTADRRFVADLCRRLGVECIEADMDVEGYISLHGGSVEMACRELRYDLFRRLKTERGASRIAVAHNADDNIETLFLNLMRGAGVEGLKGMVADTGEIIRPLLNVSRTEIEEYLNSIGQEWRTDSTNLEDHYRRNFIRNRVLPLLEERWPEVRRSIMLTQRNLRGEAAVVNKAVTPDRADMLDWDRIAGCGDPRTAIRRFLNPYGPSASQIDEMTAVAVRRLSGRVWTIGDIEVHSERDGLHIVGQNDMMIPEYHWIKVPNNPEMVARMKACRNHSICFLPSGPDSYSFRHVQTGDRISPLGMRGSRLVSDILQEAHLTRRQRRETVVLTDNGGGIIWIDGLKRSRLHLITPATPEIHIVARDNALLQPFIADCEMA